MESNNLITDESGMLHDIASGIGIEVDLLTSMYNRLRNQDRADAVDVRLLASVGIPMYFELSKVLDTPINKVNALIENSGVQFTQIEQAFRNMTSEGGIFAGLASIKNSN